MQTQPLKGGIDINTRIKSVRVALGLTQDEFADGLDCSRGVITNIEHGRVDPKDNIINRICKTYNVRKEYITDGVGEMFVQESMGDKIGAIAGAAAQRRPEDAARFFQRFIEDFGEDELLVMYEIFRRRFPEYDKEDPNAESR